MSELRSSTLLLKSLRYFWRTHLGVVLGATCATAVLVGALAVGDSVRRSLREQAENRIGGVDAVMAAGDRFFRAELAERVAEDLGGADVAPLLQLPGIVSVGGGAARAGIVDVFGVDARFWSLAPEPSDRTPPPGRAYLSESLAGQLGVGTGETVLLRVEKPSLLPRDMVMATVDDVSFALRVEVDAVLTDAQFGRFSLRASQVPPSNAFVSLAWLQEQLELPGRANLLLVGNSGGEGDVVERANASVRAHWTLADAELSVGALEDSGLFELTSERVFVEDAVAEALVRIEPGLVGVLTYFVNELKKGARTTPYSMVAAIGPLSSTAWPRPAPMLTPVARALSVVHEDVGPDGIVLNEWLAEDLGAAVGDSIALRYFVMDAGLQLREASHSLRVHSIVPMTGAAADPSLMPAFPGLHDTESCRDWEPGIPIELERIRDIDQDYWEAHRGTPKAFVDLRAGQALWQNRFGGLTAVRGPAGLAEQVAQELRETLDPAGIGLFFQDLRGPALAGGTSATDFGGLFLGLSFFLIVAALLLTALLFVFGVEQRAQQIGLLLALGFRRARVRRLFLAEASILALVGGVLGAILGMGYTRFVLAGLGTLWRDAVGAATLTFHAGTTTVVGGTVLAVLVSLGALALALRRAFDQPAVVLLGSRGGMPSPARHRKGRGRVSLITAVVALVLALVLVLVAGTSAEGAAGAFFGAGALLLVSGLFACRLLLSRMAAASQAGLGTLGALGVRNAGRRPGRSLATIALLASGTFLVAAVQANRLEPPRDFSVRASGTGGFALFGRSTLPVLRDLGTEAGREAFALSDQALQDVAIVPLRVRDGDDASCLNLSLPQNPRLLGVRAEELAARGAFRFSGTLPPGDGEAPAPWLLLNGDYGADVVPAIGDQASVTWTLHKSIGDDLEYHDEQGRLFKVRIVGTVANSILQGNLVVAEEHLAARFPSASGHRMFLIDAPAESVEAVASELTRALEDIGLEVTPTTQRLAAFNAVQNTYLLIFQALGGLGMLLGSVGLGMVVLRNALERRSELAIASAVGFPVRVIRRLLWYEHGLLLGLGLGAGVVAALVAVLPGVSAAADGLSLAPIALLVAMLAASGALWVWLASVLATRGTLLEALREE